MPVGVNLERFLAEETSQHSPRSILFLSRLAPSKRPEMFIDALGKVLLRGISFTATIVGSPASEDEVYARSLKARAKSLGLHNRLRFKSAVPNGQTPELYASHDMFVNCSPSGMFDKTLFEAAASGCRVIAASDDFHKMIDDEVYGPDVDALAEKLILALNANDDAIMRRRILMQAIARQESLGTLVERLSHELEPHVH